MRKRTNKISKGKLGTNLGTIAAIALLLSLNSNDTSSLNTSPF
jgi:hypothetical protein